MNPFYKNRRIRKTIAALLLQVLILQVVFPTVSSALTSGPVQPEVQSFEPVGTTDLVDPFTGDFTYNIPLMDVEGYPINISYHGGPTMEQEASWVGLGWNINPGCINKGIRGLPDDFNGEDIEKELYVKDEKTTKVGLGAGFEIFGAGQPKISLGFSLGGTVQFNNYRGVSVDFNTSAGLNTSFQMVSAGLNVGASIGSQTGGSVNYGAMVGLGITKSINEDISASGSFNLNTGGTYSPRTGLRRDVGFGVSISQSNATTTRGFGKSNSLSTGTSVPIGLQNHTAVISNASYTTTHAGRLKVGGEIFGGYGNVNVHGSFTKTKFLSNGTRKGYGYFNLDKATENDILDFSREKDGIFNPTMHFLPQAHITYDVYSVSGQGTGGSFRPFRNDLAGGVFDPVTTSPPSTNKSMELEFGLGNLFEAGGEGNIVTTNSESGPWSNYKRPFVGKKGGNFEDVYFKEAGELTDNNSAYLNAEGSTSVLTPEAIKNANPEKTGSATRVTRANLISVLRAEDSDTAALTDGKQLVSYDDTTGFRTYPVVTKSYIPRASLSTTTKLKRNKHHTTEIVQTQKDGRRYIFGLPVVNNIQREVTFAINKDSIPDKRNNLIGYKSGTDDKAGNGNGIDHFYSSTITPTYATSYLLTQVLSNDYSDVTGDGISDDDIGTYTKFNYSRKSADYRWRSPLQKDTAQYIPGYLSDKQDDKASYMIGSREQWMLHSVETKNYVAEFYTSKRADGRGVTTAIINGNASIYNEAPYNSPATAAASYKLDSIVLYNKHDRFINKNGAVPIKTVIFEYDYSLCKNLPNTIQAGGGKLTLKAINVRFANSFLGMSAPYRFTYSTFNPDYNCSSKDRWGNYKPQDPILTTFEFPFVNQTANNNQYAEAWSLKKIDLPSGGAIEVEYESDDYAYVENKKAMEMFILAGVGSGKSFQSGNQLFFSSSQPNLYLYFNRRLSAENSALSFKENYLPGTNLLYYNVPVELSDGKPYEPVKGYAEVVDIDVCPNDATRGFIKLKAQDLEGTSYKANPIAYTALNLGRYSLPHILFPGSDPENEDIQNITKGLKNALEEVFEVNKNPLERLMSRNHAKYIQTEKSFVRLGSPGLKKSGGGHRVKTLKFYDNWQRMAGGAALTADYGKEYFYTLAREDGQGAISSGVASYEPLMGGDELPHRVPVGYIVQSGTKFPPNDPVNLYQEFPIGESFYPGASVGYSRVTSRSIHQAQGKSSQSEEIQGFYTAKDYPVSVQSSPINTPDAKKKIKLTGITISQSSTQGFSIILNDMHGKPKMLENYVIKPLNNVRELINFKRYEYKSSGGQLSNDVPVYQYNPGVGNINVQTRKLGIETDITVDSRIRVDKSVSKQASINANGFSLLLIPCVVIPFFYPWGITNESEFKTASVTKVTQQYGILDRVINNQEGAITDVRNEVFDAQTGNALLTSVNNEFGDREYSMTHPAYWAYKELGPAYVNHNEEGVFTNIKIDSLGLTYSQGLKNYHPTASNHYDLPTSFPVARVISTSDMPKYKLGDEMLVYLQTGGQPTRMWVMGYTADVNGPISLIPNTCYMVMAPREPYKFGNGWALNQSLNNVKYRVVRSGQRNRLMESVQSVTSTASGNFLPLIQNNFLDVISMQAQTYKHKLSMVSAANSVSDTLNPFVTGKVGIHRPEKEVVNLKARNYATGTLRKSGLYSSLSYWPVYRQLGNYCEDKRDMQGTTGPVYAHQIGDAILHGQLRMRDSFETWVSNQAVTKYNQLGQELENYIEGIGYNAAVYGMNHFLPMVVAKNAKHGEVLFESFDDFGQLQSVPSSYATYQRLFYSPFQTAFQTLTSLGGTSPYSVIDTNGTGCKITAIQAHTGFKCLQVNTAMSISIPVGTPAMPAGTSHAYSYRMDPTKKWVANVWLRPTGTSLNTTFGYSPNASVKTGTVINTMVARTDIIDGWQQFEIVFTVPAGVTTASFELPAGFLYDDIRLFPIESNSKAFVYHPFTRKLMATLDENNYATFFEYDAEGNLIRTKRETEKGILTISESRNANPISN